MQTVTVSEKGQVVIPASMRRSLGIKPGMELGFELIDSTLRVTLRQPVPTSHIASGYGLLKARRSAKARNLLDFDVASAMQQVKA